MALTSEMSLVEDTHLAQKGNTRDTRAISLAVETA
jgi:hypothetical protein